MKRKPGEKLGHTEWTEEEHQALRTLYNQKTLQEIAGILGRTIASVRSKATKLKLAATKPKTFKDGLKRCATCNEYKEYSAFYKQRSTSGGLYFECRPCASISNKKKRIKQQIDEIEQQKQDFIEANQGKSFYCSLCKKERPFEDFNIWHRSDRKYFERRAYCRTCHSKNNRKRIIEKERNNEYVKFTTKS